MAQILVIDDQDSIRRVVRRTLEHEGHEVLDASDGEMGMELLALHPVDIVITDIFMPGQDGILTLRQIRKRFPDMKVIVISGGDTTGLLDLRKDAELLGAVKSLPKPFNAKEIAAVVREVLKAGPQSWNCDPETLRLLPAGDDAGHPLDEKSSSVEDARTNS